MRKMSLLAGPMVAVALGVLAGSAQAAPAVGGLKSDQAAASAVEKARCGWWNGRWRCWHSGYYYGPRRWWWRHHHRHHRHWW
jgi:hypothetical protein